MNGSKGEGMKEIRMEEQNEGRQERRRMNARRGKDTGKKWGGRKD